MMNEKQIALLLKASDYFKNKSFQRRLKVQNFQTFDVLMYFSIEICIEVDIAIDIAISL